MPSQDRMTALAFRLWYAFSRTMHSRRVRCAGIVKLRESLFADVRRKARNLRFCGRDGGETRPPFGAQTFFGKGQVPYTLGSTQHRHELDCNVAAMVMVHPSVGCDLGARRGGWKRTDPTGNASPLPRQLLRLQMRPMHALRLLLRCNTFDRCLPILLCS